MTEERTTETEKTEQDQLTEERAEERAEAVAEALQQMPTEKIVVSARPFEADDETTSIDDLIAAFPKTFTVDYKVRGVKGKIVCNRKSPLEIFPEEDDTDEIPTTRQMYEDAVRVINTVVQGGNWTIDKLNELPLTLVTRISRGVMQEISPRWEDAQEDDNA